MINFGTGGWREIIGDNFTKTNIYKIASALAQIMQDDTVIIGYDRRFMSKEASFWFIEALASNNIKALLIDKASPTPIIMYAVKKFNTEYGVAITASHNPAIYNGIKIFTHGGKDATVEVTSEISAIANQIELNEIKPFYEIENTDYFKRIDPFNDYIDSILNTININEIRNANLKIAIDPMFGVSQTSLTTILATARCEIDIINNRHDTLFGGRLPSPASESLHKLMDLVVHNHYNLGIATDGDADRIGIVDELGNFIHPNTLLCLLYYYLLVYKNWKGAVVRNLSTTHMLDRIADKYNQKCIETEVGFKHISYNMEKYQAIIGGESSGGLTVKGHIQGKDGIYAATLLVEMISITKKSISQLVSELEKEFGKSCFSENAYKFTQNKKDELIDILFNKKMTPKYKNINKIYYLDGLKIIFNDDTWISARFSGTEPVLRIFAESYDNNTVKKNVKLMEEFLNLTNKEKI
ncbi:MAG: phosphoglucomutase/phosphomannomutase family protein [Erysipelotrichaceae bacterium]|nr:phosphoglucomutase/phosphomannomutase family protein [Erysipelotrichaceae bacterium]